MKAQYQKLIKELGGSEEEVKALLRELVEKEILKRIKEVLETIGKEERKGLKRGARGSGQRLLPKGPFDSHGSN